MSTRAIATFYFVFSLAILAAAMPGGEPPSKTKTTTVTSPPKTTTVTSPPKTSTITVTAPASTPTGSTCSTGPIQCCNQVGKADESVFNVLLGLLGIVVDGVDVLLGLDCSPISVIGVGGGSCDANVVCCQNNNVGGLISIGCIPIIL
ncbi:fungal hydrophobin [Polyporus arcularius HHB13444]|uniref:Hydrophobin n=1 Tax=Polyporus arcularius HHB13444 TaxID=1314778 RepID=A0A5C3NSI6_9APHY|nr:fungal hydrophobin [Polyporus arcularius HHB13444]